MRNLLKLNENPVFKEKLKRAEEWIPQSFVNNMHKRVKEIVQGDPVESVGILPRYASLLESAGHSAKLITMSMEDMKRVFLKFDRTDFELAERLAMADDPKHVLQEYEAGKKAEAKEAWTKLRKTA